MTSSAYKLMANLALANVKVNAEHYLYDGYYVSFFIACIAIEHVEYLFQLGLYWQAMDYLRSFHTKLCIDQIL